MQDAIELVNIGKRYILEYGQRSSFKESILNLFKRTPNKKEYWALNDINLKVAKGQVLGLIGKNGSGKTTMLKLIAGITKSTRGLVKAQGQIGSLLELGVGFQLDLTGRENIYLNGLILGLPKEQIQKNIGYIIDFADIGDFIDAPVRTYSAGMYMRLGFAIATQLNPDIVLIDEVMSVGDAGFQKKCLWQIEKFKNDGKTILLVSHNLDIVKSICTKVVLLDKGRIVRIGSPEEIINYYLTNVDEEARQKADKEGFTHEISIINVYFKNEKGQIVSQFRNGEQMRIVIEYDAPKKVFNPVFGIGIEVGKISPNTRDNNYPIDYVQGKGEVEFTIRNLPLSKGEYLVSASAHNIDETRHYDRKERLFKFQVLPAQGKPPYCLMGVRGEWHILQVDESGKKDDRR